MNVWFGRVTARQELSETLFFSGMTHGVWSKGKDGYSIETSIGTVDVRSLYDIRVNGKKVGSPTQFKRVVGDWIQRG